MIESPDMNKTAQAPVHLAWTAGWDSTFRLLQLLLIDQCSVQPHYIVRPEASTGQEIDAMHRIRRRLLGEHPEARERLKPTALTDVRAIPIEPDLAAEYEHIKQSRKVQYQYLLLACYCRQRGLDEIEIGIHKDDSGFHLAEEALFERFSLPMQHFSKLEMRQEAQDHGFAHIMDLTVFCRRPRGGKPCGFCGPCHDAVTIGMGYRLPLLRRLRGYMQAPLRRWWRSNYASMSPKLKSRASRILKGRY